ncbi:MAG: tRNA 2-thiouridine(34) synthase MnmA [Elusimicrobiota bacterium]
MNRNKKICVGVSGGVDSGTALFILKNSGWEPVSVYTDFFCNENKNSAIYKYNEKAKKRASQTSDMLNVPFKVFDYTQEFNKFVEKPFIEYYNIGITPNPCIWCNALIRFGILMDEVKNMGIDYIATGHYADIKDNKLFRAGDKTKDQSYFLYQVPRERFKRIVLPLSNKKKDEVIEIARKNGLPVKFDSESQDFCLLLGHNLNTFLNKKLSVHPGKIIDEKGKIVGKHKGFQNYTIGQRRGLGGMGKKRYIIDIIPEKNTVVVGDEKDLYEQETGVNIKSDVFFAQQRDRLKVKLRSTQPMTDCTIKHLDKQKNTCRIVFDQPQKAPTPGQSAVFYRDEEVIGGGEISK